MQDIPQETHHETTRLTQSAQVMQAKMNYLPVLMSRWQMVP